MKRILNCAIVVLAIAFNYSCKSSKKAQGSASETITVLTYNVRNCLGLDNTVNYQRVANVISKINADVVAIQELDSATNRSKHVSVLHELAGLTGLVPTYNASISYQGGKYGIGILSKEKPLNVEGISLPGTEEKRSAVVVEMKNYVFVCTHFSLTEQDRIKSVSLIDELTEKYAKPVLLGGDLNATPNSSVVKAFSKNWNILTDTSKLTIPANKPTECIDYIMARKQQGRTLKVLQSVVENEPVASDHLPVWIKVSMGNN
ncbi:endonuclease/exonuclease/phosphatase family protein [Pinibacter aurantiacus]|uniref:Endonuclease/exonuclease/phosphatase family protein n=1 Tax=Pinibacter aurantiacus TaxID=2851599 RepID=A0A9E2SCQ8_9BACT|nr:endonuclease/exonuclease/phosphatase family protein [Pinibacter aurantiacus]MBV4357490.1 endonuclease/exonuclease/phosphatase family protein [Pinibacter aurantiacus]